MFNLKCVVGAIQTGITTMIFTPTKTKISFLGLLSVYFVFTLSLSTEAIKMAQRGCKVAKTWLCSEHDYSNEEGEIYMTGWQTLGFGLLVSVVAIVLSIQF